MQNNEGLFKHAESHFNASCRGERKNETPSVCLLNAYIYREGWRASADKYDAYFYFSGRDKKRSEFRFYSILRECRKNRHTNSRAMKFS